MPTRTFCQVPYKKIQKISEVCQLLLDGFSQYFAQLSRVLPTGVRLRRTPDLARGVGYCQLLVNYHKTAEENRNSP